jgi:hypothetical protein
MTGNPDLMPAGTNCRRRCPEVSFGEARSVKCLPIARGPRSRFLDTSRAGNRLDQANRVGRDTPRWEEGDRFITKQSQEVLSFQWQRY